MMKAAGWLSLAMLALAGCRTGSSPSTAKEPRTERRAVFVETLFAAVPHDELAELAREPAQLATRPDVTVYSSGGALIALQDGFAYLPSLTDPAPSGDVLETGSRNLRIGLRPRGEGELDVRLESLPAFERSTHVTAVLDARGAGILLDTQLVQDGRVLALFLRARPATSRSDLERIYAQKLADRAAAEGREASQTDAMAR